MLELLELDFIQEILNMHPDTDPEDPAQWQALCGRHQVTKKNYWDTTTGKLNTYAIVQFAPETEKKRIFSLRVKARD
jgi:hypothetical protein